MISRFEARMDDVDRLFESAPDKCTHSPSPTFSPPSSTISSNPTLISAPDFIKDSNDPGSLESVLSATPEVSVEDQALAVLRRLLRNPNADWTCETQRQGVMTILDLKQDVLAIMATGLGKTMLAIIPALMEPDYITVIVLPFRSLMTDMQRRLDEMDVPYEVYSARALKGQANIVLVSADLSQFDSWKEHITDLNQKRKVVRQVYDEIHEPLVAQRYREAMRNVYRMRAVLQAQLVGLSGTVNLTQEKALFEMFELGHNTVVLRTGSNRPELTYIWATDKVQLGELSQSVQEVLNQYPQVESSDRALIFVPRLHTGMDISSALGIGFYHGQLTDVERSSVHGDWISGKHYAMVCTSAFGAGNDYPHTRLIIHAGNPLEMTGYVQEVGRAGRDKQSAICHLILTAGWVPDLHGAPDFGGQQAMYKALFQNPACIRFKLTSHFDAKGTYCSADTRNQLCSFCKKLKEKGSGYVLILPHLPFPDFSSHSIKRGPTDAFLIQTENAKRRRTHFEASELDYVTTFKQQLDRFSGTCTLCMTHGVHSEFHDIFQQCSSLRDGPGAFQFRKFREGLRYDERRGLRRICFFCHVPQGDGDRLHPQFGNKNTCEYRDLIAPLVFGIFNHPDLRGEMEGYFGQVFESTDAFVNWLNSSPIAGHKSNLTAVFLWYGTIHTQLP
jgi:superfamily II DNA or RNA helicase